MERNSSLVLPNQCNIMQSIGIYGVVVLFLKLYYVQFHASIHLYTCYSMKCLFK